MLDELNFCNIDIQSYLLLMEGVKPVIRVGLGKDAVENAKKSADRLGIKLIVKEFSRLYGGPLENKLIHAYYSLDMDLCKQAWHAEKEGDRKRFGQLLAYPECCVDSFIKNLRDDVDYTLISLFNTKTRPSFYCNTLFVFDSKIGSDGIKTFLSNHDMFNDSKMKSLFLIRHVPCSLDCEQSIEIGKTTLRLLRSNSPNLATDIVNALKRPVLYWNYFEWIILNGHHENNMTKYDGILNFESLVKKEIKAAIETGNAIQFSDNMVEIFRCEKKTGEILRKNSVPVCINFQ